MNNPSHLSARQTKSKGSQNSPKLWKDNHNPQTNSIKLKSHLENYPTSKTTLITKIRGRGQYRFMDRLPSGKSYRARCVENSLHNQTWTLRIPGDAFWFD